MEPLEILVEQGKNVLNSMKELKRLAHKKGKERTSLFERFAANKHSFQVYSNMDASIRDSEEMQNFLHTLQSFSDEFEPARYEFEGEVNVDQVEHYYAQVLEAFNSFVTSLGRTDEVVNINHFK